MPTTTGPLQKLVYYCQAWSLVWDEKPLFRERIEAWANGPVVPKLYERHRGQFNVTTWEGDPRAISTKNKDTIKAVLKFYGNRSSQWLSDLTHQEDQWREARAGIPSAARDNTEITHAALIEYYSGLQPQ